MLRLQLGDTSLILGALVAVVYLIVRWFRFGKFGERLPPGPPGHWLFGNTPPPSHAYRYYSDLTEVYGPVYTLRYGARNVVVIGRIQAAVDIMVKQSHKLIDRPRYVAAGEIMSGGMRVVITRAGDRLRRVRTALHSALQPQSAATYEPIQTRNARNLILDILDDPEQHIEHAKRFAASVIMSITYGKTTPMSYSDPEVVAVNEGMVRFADALRPGRYLVDSYPFLKHIPLFTSMLRRYHEEEIAFFTTQINAVKTRLSKNEAKPCFVTYLLEHQNELSLSNDELAYLAGSMFGAGSDTTGGTISFLIMASACYPDAQRRAQAQLDAVVGHNRTPTFADQDKLPEVWAYIQELYRWRPVVPAGISHSTTTDVVWKDYVIPAGTEVVGCLWALGRDPDVFSNPEEFDPTRWLNDEGRPREDLKLFTWGFGRRICPGQHVADRSIFITTALMLWAFEISADPNHPIDTLAIKDGGLVRPHPFVVQFKLRIDDLREKIVAYHDDEF